MHGVQADTNTQPKVYNLAAPPELDRAADSRNRRQTVHTHRASVYQAAKLVAALLGVARVTARWRKVMATYRRVYDSRHVQADCQQPESPPEPYAL